MRKALVIPLLFASIAVARPSPKAEELHSRAMRIHRSAIVVDTHEDVPYRLEDKGWIDLSVRNTTGHVDIPRLKEGGMTAPFFAAYVPASYADSGGSTKKALEMIELTRQLVSTHPDLTFADSPAAIRDAKRRGKIAVLIGIEGGHAIENSLGALDAFHRLGVRYMTLTHTNTNGWADSSGSFWSPGFDPKKYAVHGGLTDFGRQVVSELNRLGMMVDISHVSDKTFQDALEASAAPVIASHSSSRALASAPRNMTDDMLRALARKGGVLHINYYEGFLDNGFAEREKTLKAEQAEQRKKH